MSDTVNIVEAKIVLQQMREDYAALPNDMPNPKDREKRWVLGMNIQSYQIAIAKNEGTYVAPF